VLKEAGMGHEFRDCRWSDTMLSASWLVWHNDTLFLQMKAALSCPLNSFEQSVSSDSVTREWFKWLTKQNEKGTAYNLHAVWLWYFSTRVEPSLGG